MADDGYDIQIEIEKFTWADIIIFQFPIFRMNLPYAFKKYVDEVYMTGYGVLFKDDGRTDGGRYGTEGMSMEFYSIFIKHSSSWTWSNYRLFLVTM